MADEKKISDLLSAPDTDVDENTLVEVSTEDNGSYNSYKGALGALFDKILRAVQFTQRLNTKNKTVFGAINELKAGGGGGDTVSWTQVTQSGTKIAEIDINGTSTDVYAPSGGGSANIVECTQAQYDAWEQGGTLDPDTAYFINDGNIGNDIINDSLPSSRTVYSSNKTIDILGDYYALSDADLKNVVASGFSTGTSYSIGDYCIYNHNLYRFTSAKSAGAWDSTKVTSVKIGRELKAIKSYSKDTTSIIAYDNTVTATGCTLYRQGNVVFCNGTFKCSSTGTWKPLLKGIPNDYKPVISYFGVAMNLSSTNVAMCPIYVANNGNIAAITTAPNANDNYQFSLSWFIE